MKPTPTPVGLRRARALAAWLCLVILNLPVAAQDSPGTGSIQGQVYNPTTREYIRNATVSVAGTNLSTISENGGFFRLDHVPAGEVNVTVQYAGYEKASASIVVAPGRTTTRDFDLVSALAPRTPEEETLRMEAYVVHTEREGNAKALQQQRASMTVGRSVASDVFGDVTEGNVGEFLKYLPGIELEYVEADTRGPRLGGMDPEYTGVSIDGMKLASADAFVQYGSTENGSAGSATRSFGFEQVSINSIESIQINRVVSAEMDADAAAGNINLKTKRAFDSKGRRITWNVGTVLNTEEFHLDRSLGPGDGRGYKLKPTYSLGYADVFFNNRLGLLVGLSESNLYNEQYRADHTYNRTTTAGDPRPQVLTGINFKDGPKWTERFTTTFSADFKATPDLVLSLSSTFNAYDARFYNRTLNFTTTRAANTGDGINSLIAGGAGAVAPGGGNGVKLTNSFTVIPRFEYRRGSLVVDGALAYSRSRNDYDNLVRGTAGNAAVNSLTGLAFTGLRDDAGHAAWQITQTGGRDWTDLAGYTNPRLTNDGRFAFNEVYVGELNAKYTTQFRLPTYLKFGGKWREYAYKSDQHSPIETWSYIGSGGNVQSGVNATTGVPTFSSTAGTYAGFLSPFQFDMGQTGARFVSLNGGGSPAFASRDALAALINSAPANFARIATPANYETALYLNHRDYVETVSSTYLMANTRAGQWVFQGGVRYELTEKESTEYDPLPNSAVAAAGFPVTLQNGQPTGAPTSLAGIHHKYTARPRVSREGEYDNLFPSFAAKYNISENLQADFGWGRAIKRPDINRVNGVWQINEVAGEIRAPNPLLLPELSEKYAAALSWFFGRGASSNLQVVLSHTKIKNLLRENDLTSEQFGNTDPDFANYTFITGTSEGPDVTFRSLELSYWQNLTFLPKLFQGTSVNASYTRTYATERRPGLTPHTFKAGLNYRYKRLALGVNGDWRDTAPWTNTVGRYRPSTRMFDCNVSYKLTDRMTLYAQGRNIFEREHRVFEEIGGNSPVLWRLENYGSNWTFGVRGVF